jgi:hypothetical protein
VQLVCLGALLRLIEELAKLLAETDPAKAAALRRIEFCGVVDDILYVGEASVIYTLRDTVLALHQRWQFPLQTAKLLVEGVPAPVFTYSGISMDLRRDALFMDGPRRAKWSAKLRGFRDAAGGLLTREEVASAHGVMQRVALVFPLGRCWLFGIRRLLAAAHLHPRVQIGPEVREDMQVYIDFLGLDPSDAPPTPALTRHGPRRAVRMISDASFGALAGATLRDGAVEYWVHVLTEDELPHVGPGRDDMHITRLELVAAAHNLLVWPPGSADHVEIVADNKGSCDMVNAGVARRDRVCNAVEKTSPS